MRASVHPYGPHRKPDQPKTVTVWPATPAAPFAPEVEVEVPYEIRRQRYQLNQRAYDRHQAIERERARRP